MRDGVVPVTSVAERAERDRRSPPALALRSVLAVVVAKSALNLAFAGRYGWQRDELYAVAGRHLQGGYVEFPPVTALFSALATVGFCRDYRHVGTISMPVENEERGLPIARCTLDGSLAKVWPRILDTYQS